MCDYRYNVVKSVGERLTDWYISSRKKIMKSRTVVWAKLQYSLAAHRFHQFLYPPQQVHSSLFYSLPLEFTFFTPLCAPK